jgi:DNA-binding transcriptional MocR family regulator
VTVEALTWAWDQSTETPGHKLVLLALADRANAKDGTCFPSASDIAWRTGFSERTVRAYVDTLEATGFITKVHRRRRPDGTLGTWTYRVNHRDPVATGSPLPLATQNRTSDTQTSPPVTPTPRAEPTYEPTLNPSLTSEDAITPEAIAEEAGRMHTALQGDRGVKVHDRKKLQAWKRNQLLADERPRLEQLSARHHARVKAGHSPIPIGVLGAAVLGDNHSLTLYPLPEVSA